MENGEENFEKKENVKKNGEEPPLNNQKLSAFSGLLSFRPPPPAPPGGLAPRAAGAVPAPSYGPRVPRTWV